MNNKSKFNIIAGLAMIFLFVTSCDTEKEDVLEKGDEIQKVEIPSSDATNPIVAGQMIVIHGEGFTANSEIWIQPSPVTKAEGKEVKAEIISVSENGISFITPKVSGQCDILLRQNGKSQTLGSIYMEEKDLESLSQMLSGKFAYIFRSNISDCVQSIFKVCIAKTRNLNEHPRICQ